MHIPDNFLSPPVWAILGSCRRAGGHLGIEKGASSHGRHRLPLLGVMGAFIFAAQMINFPLAVGTSGHLVGGALLACVLGPWPAALVLHRRADHPVVGVSRRRNTRARRERHQHGAARRLGRLLARPRCFAAQRGKRPPSLPEASVL